MAVTTIVEDVEPSTVEDSTVALAAGESVANSSMAVETADEATIVAESAQDTAEIAVEIAANSEETTADLRAIIAQMATDNAAVVGALQADVSRLNEAMILLADIKQAETDNAPQEPDPEPNMVHPLNRRLWKPLFQKDTA